MATAIAPLQQAVYRFHLPITTEADLALFLDKALGVRIPDTQVCPNHTTPWRAFCDAYFAKSPVAVWKASRGFGGKTFTLGTLGLVEAATLGADVNILGGSGEQSLRVHEVMATLLGYGHALRQLLASDPTTKATRFRAGNSIKALMASSRSVRGPHPQRLRLDEVDEMDVEVLDASMGQPMSRDGVPAQTVMSSTHQYADGTMTEILRRAGEKGWPVYEWCWKETLEPGGWLAPAEVERTRQAVTAGMWQVEYDLQEPSPESRAIMPRAVAAMFRRELGEYAGANTEYVEAEAPEQGAVYAHGVDWARSVDWTIIITLRCDVDPMRVVAFERIGRVEWPQMTALVDSRLKRYGGAGLYDGTGLGDIVGQYLRGAVESFVMVGRARTELLSEYIIAVERGEIESPFIRHMEAEHRYASIDDLYGSGHLPDTMAAMALAYRASELRRQIAAMRTPPEDTGWRQTRRP